MEQQNRRSKKAVYGKKRRRNIQIFYIVLIAVILIAAIAVACSLLLKISLVSVTGSSRYSQQEILDACTVKAGDNLVVCDTKEAKLQIEQKLAYIKKATVTKKFPSKIIVNVESDYAAFAFSQGEAYILLDEDYKVLEITDSAPEELCVVYGAMLLSPEAGKKCVYLSEESQKTVEAVIDMMKTCKYDFSKITQISFEDESNISYVFENRIKVILGPPSDLEYKLTFSRSILLNEDGKGLSESDIGIFDISLASDTNRGIFKKQDSLESENSSPSSSEAAQENPDNTENNSQPEENNQSEPEESSADGNNE